MSGGTGQAGFHLLDVAALVVGYGMASMLVRAYWHSPGQTAAVEAVVIALVFTWLGLAMSGPVVLLTRRPPPPGPEAEGQPGPRTWAELAWMIIGFYWIGLTLLVVPARVRGGRFLDSAVLGLFPVLAGLGLRFCRPRRPGPSGDLTSWTHRAGVALLVTWPIAWIGLMLLGNALP
jgi:hypothetical protein